MENGGNGQRKGMLLSFLRERIQGDIVGKCGIEVGLKVAYRGIDVVEWLQIIPNILFCSIVLATLLG